MGILELTLIIVIALIVFWPGRLPALGEGLGKAIKGFKQGMKGDGTIDGRKAKESDDPPAKG